MVKQLASTRSCSKMGVRNRFVRGKPPSFNEQQEAGGSLLCFFGLYPPILVDPALSNISWVSSNHQDLLAEPVVLHGGIGSLSQQHPGTRALRGRWLPWIPLKQKQWGCWQPIEVSKNVSPTMRFSRAQHNKTQYLSISPSTSYQNEELCHPTSPISRHIISSYSTYIPRDSPWLILL